MAIAIEVDLLDDIGNGNLLIMEEVLKYWVQARVTLSWEADYEQDSVPETQVEREEWFALGVGMVFEMAHDENRTDGLGELVSRVDIGLTASASEP